MVWLGVAKKTLCMENYCNYEPFLASYEVFCSPNTRLCHKKKNTRQANVNPCKDRDTSFGTLLVYL